MYKIFKYIKVQFQGFFAFVIFFNLKGHGNEADFLGFIHKTVRHRPITLHFEPFRFWLRIHGNIPNRK